jgi:hypothetical protein
MALHSFAKLSKTWASSSGGSNSIGGLDMMNLMVLAMRRSDDRRVKSRCLPLNACSCWTRCCLLWLLRSNRIWTSPHDSTNFTTSPNPLPFALPLATPLVSGSPFSRSHMMICAANRKASRTMNRQDVCSMPKKSWTEHTLCEPRSTRL